MCFFQNVYFSSKNSFRQLGCSFDYLHKKSPQKDRMYFSSRHEKTAEVDALQKNFSRESFNDPLECSFNKPAPIFPARRPITLVWSRTKTSVKQVFQKVLWPEFANWTPKKQKILHGPAKFLPPKNRTKVLNQFFEIKISLKTFPRYAE